MGHLFSVNLDGDGAWPDLADKTDRIVHITDIDVAVLAHGTKGGRPSVAFRMDLPDGQVVFAETTLRLFLTAAAAMKGRFPFDAKEAGF